MSILTDSKTVGEAGVPIAKGLVLDVGERQQFHSHVGASSNADISFNFSSSNAKLHVQQSGHKGYSSSFSVNHTSHAVVGSGTLLQSHPVFRTTDGKLMVVYDPFAKGAFETTREDFRDPQLCYPRKIKCLAQNLSGLPGDSYDENSADPSFVQRPANAFIIFRTEKKEAIKLKFPHLGNNDISRVLGRMWREISRKEKAHYQQMADTRAQGHRVQYPGPKYPSRRPEDAVRASINLHRRFAMCNISGQRAANTPKIGRWSLAGCGRPSSLADQFVATPSKRSLGAFLDAAECAMSAARIASG